MKTAKWILVALLFLATTAFAEEWTLVAHDSNEIVFVDRTSIFEVGDLKKARVLRSFSKVQTIGDTAFPHKSEILLYAVRCEDRSLGFEEWTMTAGEIGWEVAMVACLDRCYVGGGCQGGCARRTWSKYR